MGKKVNFSKKDQERFQSKDNKRKFNNRKLRKRILIVCEGEKTEPNYFKSLKKELPRGLVEVDILGAGANTLSIIKIAKEKIKESKKTNMPYDNVWVVFDRDSFPPSDFDNAISSAKANNFNCAWSNEAFELWYLLHFEFRHTAMSRVDYSDKLSKYLDEKYKKNNSNMYDKLLDKQNTAVNNAKKLLNQHSSCPPSRSNPATKVHLLVNELNSYIIKEWDIKMDS